MRSFIGTANYMRDHIRNHDQLLAPMHRLITRNSTRNQFIEWKQEDILSFEQIKETIEAIPTLYFINYELPIELHTDASDYGIGAYLFQWDEGIQKPVRFISKSLSPIQKRWTVIEKECYAIYFAFKEFEYLIRDSKFLLRTDHLNLIYINEPKSPKVARWKLLIQDYDFTVEFIKGKDNVMADAFSRLSEDLDDDPEFLKAPRKSETINNIVPNDLSRSSHELTNYA